MSFINNSFKKTFIITGNHEYYNTKYNIQETNKYLKSYFEKFENISFLDNSIEHYQDHCFIGTTLWSKITNPRYKINDVYNIPMLDINKYNKLNKECVEFLTNALNENKNNVVITHHLPSDLLTHNKYKTSQLLPYNQWFYCDLNDLILLNKNSIKCWIYGHTHTQSNVNLHGIPFLCNPIGYPDENENINFDINIII